MRPCICILQSSPNSNSDPYGEDIGTISEESDVGSEVDDAFHENIPNDAVNTGNRYALQADVTPKI